MHRTLLLPLLLAAAAPAAAQPTCAPDNAGITLPRGVCAFIAADSLGNVRHLAVGADGTVFAAVESRRGPGGLLALEDADGDGRFERRRRLWENGGNGVTTNAEYLFFATNDAVLRFRLPVRAGQAPDTIVKGLPTGGHQNKTVALGPDGALFVNIGSRTNSCQERDRQDRSAGLDPCTELDTRAGVWRFRADRLHQQQSDGVRFATGLRNMVALTVHPGTGELYGVMHGRDQLAVNWGFPLAASAELPSEEFVHIRAGDVFGWPYCYHDRIQDRLVLAPEYGGDGRTVGRCTGHKPPLIGFPAHWAPNAVAFATGTRFPARYQGGAFIAFHGSWNRAPLPQAGFNVVYVPFENGAPVGTWEVFADGFTRVGARPTGLLVLPDGSLLVSADVGQRIWRITVAEER